MGWGGILGAIAQGLGTGMMTNAKEGYEDERLQKQLDWKSAMLDKELDFKKEQAGLDRDHDFAVIQARERSEIAVAAARSAIDIKEYKQKLALGGGKDSRKQEGDVVTAVGLVNEAIAGIDKQILNQGGEATEEQLNTRNKYLQKRRDILATAGGDELRKTQAGAIFSTLNGYEPISKKQASPTASEALTTLINRRPKRPEVPSPTTSFNTKIQEDLYMTD